MSKKKNTISDAPQWTICDVQGYTVACDPGRQTITPYPRMVNREQIKVGMNLASHCNYLPDVKVKEIGDNYLILRYSGKDNTIFTGGYLQTPKYPLDYAYSEVEIWLK